MTYKIYQKISLFLIVFACFLLFAGCGDQVFTMKPATTYSECLALQHKMLFLHVRQCDEEYWQRQNKRLEVEQEFYTAHCPHIINQHRHPRGESKIIVTHPRPPAHHKASKRHKIIYLR